MSRYKYSFSLLPVICLFVIIVSIYSWNTPPFEAPDEHRHFWFITWLLTEHQLPPMGEEAWQTKVAQEAGQPPLYYAVASIPIWLYQQIAPSAMVDHPLVFRPNLTYFGPPPRKYHDNDNIAIHYPSDIRPLRGESLALFLARGVTITFGVLLIYATHKLGLVFFKGDKKMAWAMSLIVALHPQILFLSGGVSNDIPMTAFAMLALWQLLLLLQEGVNTQKSKQLKRHALMLGIFSGLAIMTKISALTLGPAIALAYAWLFYQAPSEKKKQILEAFLISGAAVVLISGWWFGRSWWVYGSPFGLSSHDYAPWAHTGIDAVQRAPFFTEWDRVFESYWVAIGWGSIRFGGWVYALLYLIVTTAIVGLGIKVKRFRHKGGRLSQGWRSPRAIFILLMAVTIITVLMMLEMWMRRVTADYGRLMFPALGAILLFLMMGWQALWDKLKWAYAVFLLLLSLATPAFLIIPAFHPDPLTKTEISLLQDSINWRFGDIVELISVKPLVTSVRADEDSLFPMEICYKTLKPSGSQPYHLFVHIIGPESALIANRYTIPGLGALPTEVWEPNTYMCDHVAVRIWENLAETLVYKIEIGFITPDLEHRLPAFDSNGNPLDTTFIGEVLLIADKPVEPFAPKDNEPVTLIKADFNPIWQPGTTLDYTLHWGVGEGIPQNYQLFVHLRDLETGQPVAQGDGAPFGGWYGTEWWQANEVLVEPRHFQLPENIPAGDYKLVVGFYDLNLGTNYGEEWEVGNIRVGSNE